MGDIGVRAADAIRRMSGVHDVSLAAECRSLGATYGALYCWEHGETDPGSFIIARMLENGYDINYVLLGKEKKNA